jgi:hypothetical protein
MSGFKFDFAAKATHTYIPIVGWQEIQAYSLRTV